MGLFHSRMLSAWLNEAISLLGGWVPEQETSKVTMLYSKLNVSLYGSRYIFQYILVSLVHIFFRTIWIQQHCYLSFGNNGYGSYPLCVFPLYRTLSIEQQVLSSHNWSPELLFSQQDKKSVVIFEICIDNPNIIILGSLPYVLQWCYKIPFKCPCLNTV